MEQLRTLVSVYGWECCVIWKVSKDQRFIEWLDCCCAGAENLPQEPGFAASQCRDTVLLHSRTKACDLLAQFPPSMHIEDSGVYAETLISDQPRWLHLSHYSTSVDTEPKFATRLLMPVHGGLVELFGARRVSEDQHIIDYIAENCNFPPLKEDNSINSTDTTAIYDELLFTGPKFETANSTDIFYDEFMNQLYNFNVEDGLFQGMDSMLVSDVSNTGIPNQASGSDRQQHGYDLMEARNIEMGSSDSISDCSDQLDEDDAGAMYRKKSGKGPQSKNLIAERKRRKKLNERLYKLRSLVPIISKLDRASILGDAVDFLKELQKQKKDLEDELQQQSDNEYLHEDTNSFLGQSEALMEKDQLEAGVEVTKIDRSNALFIKFLCENKPGSFVGLLEALDHLGLEVTNVNITTRDTWVSNVLQVQGKEGSCIMLEADRVKDSLLSTIRNSFPTGGLRRPNLAAPPQ